MWPFIIWNDYVFVKVKQIITFPNIKFLKAKIVFSIRYFANISAVCIHISRRRNLYSEYIENFKENLFHIRRVWNRNNTVDTKSDAYTRHLPGVCDVQNNEVLIFHLSSSFYTESVKRICFDWLVHLSQCLIIISLVFIAEGLAKMQVCFRVCL